MSGKVWILDSTWPPEDLKERKKRFPGLDYIGTRGGIQKQVRKLASKPSSNRSDDFWFVHQSDIGEVADLLDALLQADNFRLYSGASAGAHEGVLPRSMVSRKLDDFLSYWSTGDPESARQVLLEKLWWVDRIRLWTDRVQHDYINLLAPIDLLSAAASSAEIDPSRYRSLRADMMDRLVEKRDALLMRQAGNLGALTRVFEEVIELAQTDDPAAKGLPPLLSAEKRIGSVLQARVLHVDDEIDNGWDLVMPELFGDQYEYLTEPDDVLLRVSELERDATAYLLLLDLGLRSGDSPVPKAWRGVDLLRQLRVQFPAAPILAFSARDDQVTYREVMEAGANGFIQKPCRTLSSDSDAQIFASVRKPILNARYDVYRAFLYRAVDTLYQGLKDESVSKPFVEGDDWEWRKRLGNLGLALNRLLTVDFERCSRDQTYANTTIRELLLALFRPLEPPSAHSASLETSPESLHWKLHIAKSYRNLCAHVGRGRDVTNLDIRDVMLVTMLLLDEDSLGVALPENIRQFLGLAYRQLFISATATVASERWQERQRAPRSLPPLQWKLLKIPPQNVAFEEFPAEDHSLLVLIADKILSPNFDTQGVVDMPPEMSTPLGPQEPYRRSEASLASRSSDSRTDSEKMGDGLGASRRKPIKGMEHFFKGEGANRVIRLGQKYSGVVVDGSDPEQRDFFSWYFDRNMKKYLSEYSDEVLAFLGAVYSVGPYAREPSPPAPVTTEDPEREPHHIHSVAGHETAPDPISAFNIALYRFNDSDKGLGEEEATRALEENLPNATLDRSRRYTVMMETMPESPPSPGHRGVRLRSRVQFSGTRFLQIDPVTSRPTIADEGREILSYKEASRLVGLAAEAVGCVRGTPLTSSEVACSGRFTPVSAGRSIAGPERFRSFFQGKRIAVVDEIPGGNPTMRAEWERTLARSTGVEITGVERADALVILIPEKSPSDWLEGVYDRWKECGRPWKVVSPGSGNKDWNVLVALASRFGPLMEPFSPYRPREPNLFFFGLDLGHERGVGSFLAATLVDSRGRLLGWSRIKNTESNVSGTVERIAWNSLVAVLRALWPLLERYTDDKLERVVIHRDGRTLEPVDEYVGMIMDEFGIDAVDWVDVDKQRSPLFFLDSTESNGQFAVFEDVSGQSEMWLRTSPGAQSRYARPLCLIVRSEYADLETLGLEVFDLSNVIAQDYQTKVKLPVTTYFADGFSSTGEKTIRFWGYEHLYQCTS